MDILKELNIPLMEPTRIPVKKLEEELHSDGTERRFLEKHISSIKLVSLLNEQTNRIRKYVDDDYSYQVIYVIQIELKTDEALNELCRIVHSAFPEPTLLILNNVNINYLSAAFKRINKNDKTKTVIEDCVSSIITSEYRDINLKNINASNLKEYYEEIIDIVYRHKVYDIARIAPNKNKNYKKFIRDYEEVSAQISKLQDEYNKASMMADKARIDDELYLYENKRDLLIKYIKGE